MTAYIITIVVESLIIALGIGLGIYGVVRHRRRFFVEFGAAASGCGY